MTDNTQYTDIDRGNNDVTPEGVLAGQSEVLLDDSQRATGWHEDANQEWEEREARNELKHVAGLGELQDVTEVEYRKVRLERVVLVGVWSSAVTTQAKAEESLRELAALAETAGAVVCDGLLQHRSKPDAATYVGSGKAKEIADIVAREEADTIIVDDDLPPSQRRALEDAAKVKVVDRTAVILDIFAQHATSREGKAQVELAQLEYMLPRLRGWGGSLSRQAGGRAAGADAIISRLHTHDMEKMGALAKRMPWTAAACLIGCLAISAIPPLNGFISEWYTWQSLFSLSRVEAVALQLAGPIAMVMLAVTGGLAVMCFVKMYGITFCGAPRSTHAEEAQEVPNTMIVAMLLLAALCILIALSGSWLAPKIMHIAHAFTDTPPVTVASGIALVPGTFHTQVTPSLLLLLLLAMPLLPGLYWLWCRSRRAAFRRTGDAWACGYGWENAMAPSGNGVMQPLRVVFSALFRLRQQLDPTLRLNKGLAHVTARAQSTEPFWDERVIRPIVSATQRLAKEIQHLQSGDFRLYCLYVVAALVVLLIAIAV